MPKENINSSSSDGLRAEVCWRTDPGDGSGHVQIATVRTVEPIVTMTYSDGSPVPVSSSSTTLMESLNGLYMDVNREQINRLIRALRRARDAAYGVDA